MKEFDKRYIIYGNLKGGDENIGEARCELVTNKLDTSSLNAIFSVFNGDIAKLTNHFGSTKGFSFRTESNDEKICFFGEFPCLNFSFYTDEILNVKITSCEIHRKAGGEKINNLISRYFIRPAYTYDRASRTIFKHWSKGLLFGWNGWKKEWGMSKEVEQESEWNVESFSLPSMLGSAEMLHTLLFLEEEIEGREIYKAVNQLMVQFKVDGSLESDKEIIENLNSEMADILLTLSFIEGDFIDWSYNDVSLVDVNGKQQEEFEFYKKARKRDDERINKSFFTINGKNLRSTHARILSNLQKCEKKEKDIIRNIIERFIVACRANAVDTRLIYLHSCLDVLIQFFEIKGKDSFSKRLLNLCKLRNVGWEDIYTDLSELSIENEKMDFPINALRNNMLHHGIYPDDFQVIIMEERNARALCERLILSIFEIDYKNSGLGSVNIR